MNDNTHSWADAWTASQQALLEALFPLTTPGKAGEDGAAGGNGTLEQHYAELRDTWQQSIAKWTELVQQGSETTPITPEALRALFAPSGWNGSGNSTFDAALRQVLDGPKYATLFDLDRQLLELRQLAAQRDRDVAAFQAIVQQGWTTAFQRYASDPTSTKAQAPTSWRGMADRWLGVVNDTFIEVHRSQAFIEAQRKMLRSASDHRLQERKIAEAWCEAFHIPTRTEMDEMQKSVVELRRHLRALQRANPPPPAASKPATAATAAPRKRASAQRRAAAQA